MPVPFLDLSRQNREIRDRALTLFSDILEKSAFIGGAYVQEFEANFARFCQVPHGVSVNSGTDALRLAIAACGLEPGDEIITVPFTFIATAEVIAQVGAVPVFVDIERDTFNLDTGKIEERITPRTRAILPVHLFGHPAEMDPILDLAKAYSLRVIEDCAQAFGAQYKGKKVGSFGDLGCFSFFPSKNLACYGDGGMVITGDDDLAKTVRMLRNHGTSVKYHHSLLGYNSRLDEIQAAILRVKLPKIDAWNEARRKNARSYGKGIHREGIKTPEARSHVSPVYHQYTLRCTDRENVAQALQEAGVATAVYYPVPLHRQEVFAYLPDGGKLEESETASRCVLSLPMCPQLTEEEIGKICHVINEIP